MALSRDTPRLFRVAGIRTHELVVRCVLPSLGYEAYIAVHSSKAGPGVGGIRTRRYASRARALNDVLGLSRAMTLKCALAGLPLGGAKSVILSWRSDVSRAEIFRAHGRAIAALDGRYIAAPDLGTTTTDAEYARQATRYVAGLRDGIGEPGPFTARGVRRAMQAGAQLRWGSPSLLGRTVAVQGCGSVGAALGAELRAFGAEVIVADVDLARAKAVARAIGARRVPAAAIMHQEADIFAPCALGGILGGAGIALLRTAIVCGGANNQLPRGNGSTLGRRGILYVPDFLANAGGVISGASDILGWDGDRVRERIEQIFDTAVDVLERSARERQPPARVALRMAEERLALLARRGAA